MRRGAAMLGVLAGLVLASACASAPASGPPGGAALRARLVTEDGASVTLLRWTAHRGAPRVLVVPELGFDASLVAPLCRRLRASGWDCATLEGRQLSGADGTWAGWCRDVARAAAALGEAPRVVAIGVGGAAGFALAAQGGASGVVAVNVPLRFQAASFAVADALADTLFDPSAWIRAGRAPVLLGGGRHTTREALHVLARAARPLPASLRRDVAARYASRDADTLPPVPVRLLVSVADNLVPPEDALGLGAGAPGYAAARRMGRIELFHRNYGHLDWLADPEALADVYPVLLAQLEALP